MRFAIHLAKVIRPVLGEGSLTILDFGGGDGTIAKEMAEGLISPVRPSATVTVVEYQDEVVESSEHVTMRHESSLDAVDKQVESFDIIIASAIIEHLPEAKDETERLFCLLKPGGVLYVRTPFVVPIMRLMNSVGLKLDFTFPGHLHDMGQGFWEGYFSQLSASGPYRIVTSQPSIVETTFSEHPARTLFAYLLKSPWLILRSAYPFVGGWEIFVQKS